MTKLYCIPGGGTPASVFFKWKPIFKDIADIKTLDYKRDDKANPPLTAESIAETFFEKIKDEIIDCESYAFVSSCTGSLIEYELYKKIKSSDLHLPNNIIIFSAFAPNSEFYSQNKYICKQNREYLKDIYLALFSKEIFETPEKSAEKCADFLIETNTNGADIVVPDKNIIGPDCTYEQELMLDFANSTIKLLKVDWQISAQYSATKHQYCPINCNLNIIHGSKDKLVPKVESEKWQDFAENKFCFTEVDGDHNIITNNTSVCTEIINKILKEQVYE